jgi:hypothetical protein
MLSADYSNQSMLSANYSNQSMLSADYFSQSMLSADYSNQSMLSAKNYSNQSSSQAISIPLSTVYAASLNGWSHSHRVLNVGSRN